MGYPPIRQRDLWVGKGHRDKPLWKWFQETVSALSNEQPRRLSNCTCAVTYIAEAPDCDPSAHHLELDGEHSYQNTALCRRNTRKEIGEDALICKPASSYSGYFRIQRSDFRGVSCFLLRSAVCQVGWPRGHACICSYISARGLF